MEETKTQRGFPLLNFEDRYGEKCSLQESSLAPDTPDGACVWLGIDEANPRICEFGGWSPVSFPEGTLFSTRMHLTRAQLRELMPYLQRFVDTGELFEPEEATP